VIGMLREPAELTIADDGTIALPLGLLAEAGLSPGSRILAYTRGDGRIVLRRQQDALQELLESGELA
jgi:bifunctional DNA-binding transcriptional regulator/antitoxin component of YhaV-PrlF toxin-antitoxin module